ncbi:hypothetical protein O6H91_04G081700 [Diphasiastrum complanatum]|uniref:Uncharacterized protein n=1 Tax=Diphasiastrum complanatum TaxID=34168 RepID=A0ACC2DYP7_DIPCM|nr:hypothetical protein O6H91_04G081700 [Diphasiastrum complanatum]
MAALELKKHRIAFIPGTGRMGGLIADHVAKAGLNVIIGSRSKDKAVAAAAKISHSSSNGTVTGFTNEEAASLGTIIVWSPFGPLAERDALLKSLAQQLKDKVIIDVTNILYLLDESSWGQVSSTLLNEKALGVPARWTTAFKSTFWKLLEALPDTNNPHHTFVAGDDPEAVDITIALVESIPGFKGVKAGGLKYSKLVEVLGPTWLVELDKLNGGGNYRTGWRFGL